MPLHEEIKGRLPARANVTVQLKDAFIIIIILLMILKLSFQGRKSTQCCFNIYKPHEPEPSQQPCVLCGFVVVWFQLSCFPPQLRCVAPIHAETAVHASVKRTTLNASVLQAIQGVSAMSVNTTPRSVVFMILTECI